MNPEMKRDQALLSCMLSTPSPELPLSLKLMNSLETIIKNKVKFVIKLSDEPTRGRGGALAPTG